MDADTDAVTSAEPRHPDAVAPERHWSIDAQGVRLHVHEWGDPTAPPLLLTHGMFDHGRGFDLLAPLLVAGGYRVLALDARAPTREHRWLRAL